LAEKGYDPDFGARPLGRVIQVELKDRIVDDVLFGDLSTGGRVRVDRDDAGLTFDIQPRS
jgi:ATP-dependent Clp protease ATP-binding subunit ClpA